MKLDKIIGIFIFSIIVNHPILRDQAILVILNIIFLASVLKLIDLDNEKYNFIEKIIFISLPIFYYIYQIIPDEKYFGFKLTLYEIIIYFFRGLYRFFSGNTKVALKKT